MSNPLPFSERTTAATATFACIFVAATAIQLLTGQVTPIVGQLFTEHGQLAFIYQNMIATNEVDLDTELQTALTAAIVQVSNLVVTLEAFPSDSTNQFQVSQLLTVAKNALMVLESITVS